jgi:hypothetical protein
MPTAKSHSKPSLSQASRKCVDIDKTNIVSGLGSPLKRHEAWATSMGNIYKVNLKEHITGSKKLRSKAADSDYKDMGKDEDVGEGEIEVDDTLSNNVLVVSCTAPSPDLSDCKLKKPSATKKVKVETAVTSKSFLSPTLFVSNGPFLCRRQHVQSMH